MNRILVKVLLGIALGAIAVLVIRKSSTAAPLPRLDGSVQIVASVLQTVPVAEVAAIRVTVSGPDMEDRTETLTQMGSQWQGVITGLRVGQGNTLSAEAFDSSGKVLFSAHATGLSFSSTQRAMAALALQRSSIAPSAAGKAPRITGIVSSGDVVKPGGSLSFGASVASGTPGSALTYEWTASAGSLSAPKSASTTWTAPAKAGPVTFSFTATGPDGLTTSASFTLAVEHSHGLPALVEFNHAPQVVDATPVPATVKLGAPLALSATVADEDPNTLSYRWSAACKGIWRDAQKPSATFIPAGQGPRSVCTPCAVSLIATAGTGESTTRTSPMCAGPEVAPEGLPQIQDHSQSANTVSPGDTVVFAVTAQDPLGGLLGYFWSASVGTIEEIEKTNSTSKAKWTAPRCVPRGATLSFEARVGNVLGAATVPFTLTGLPTCACPMGRATACL